MTVTKDLTDIPLDRFGVLRVIDTDTTGNEQLERVVEYANSLYGDTSQALWSWGNRRGTSGSLFDGTGSSDVLIAEGVLHIPPWVSALTCAVYGRYATGVGSVKFSIGANTATCVLGATNDAVTASLSGFSTGTQVVEVEITSASSATSNFVLFHLGLFLPTITAGSLP